MCVRSRTYVRVRVRRAHVSCLRVDFAPTGWKELWEQSLKDAEKLLEDVSRNANERHKKDGKDKDKDKDNKNNKQNDDDDNDDDDNVKNNNKKKDFKKADKKGSNANNSGENNWWTSRNNQLLIATGGVLALLIGVSLYNQTIVSPNNVSLSTFVRDFLPHTKHLHVIERRGTAIAYDADRHKLCTVSVLSGTQLERVLHDAVDGNFERMPNIISDDSDGASIVLKALPSLIFLGSLFFAFRMLGKEVFEDAELL